MCLLVIMNDMLRIAALLDNAQEHVDNRTLSPIRPVSSFGKHLQQNLGAQNNVVQQHNVNCVAFPFANTTTYERNKENIRPDNINPALTFCSLENDE